MTLKETPGRQTLGQVLYSAGRTAAAPEEDWLELVHRMRRGEQAALHALFERTHRPVYTLLVRLTGSPQRAADLTAEVFFSLWKSAGAFDPRASTVLGWVMNQARTCAIERFVSPREVVRTSSNLQVWLAERIAAETGGTLVPPPAQRWVEPPWENVAPGISCKLLSQDAERHVASMMVRLVPGGEYPPHTHAASEELFLLDGELWIDDRKLYAGDYNFAPAGTSDKRVWSETGCACVLIASSDDLLG
jgi:DNA-directed RNA polymerase specialized sigma24 family protein